MQGLFGAATQHNGPRENALRPVAAGSQCLKDAGKHLRGDGAQVSESVAVIGLHTPARRAFKNAVHALAIPRGAEARGRISGRGHYDLLLLDNQLPGVSGIELLRHARSLSHRRRTPVIVLSASEVETEAWRAGADAFLKKPDDMGAIAGTIKRLLKGRT